MVATICGSYAFMLPIATPPDCRQQQRLENKRDDETGVRV